MIPSKLPGSGHKRFEMSPLTACFRAWLSDAATNRYRRIKLRLSFWLQSTLAAYRRGFVEFPLDKSLLGRLAPADFWAQERAPCGRRCVRRALCPRGLQCFNKAEYQRKSKPQFMSNPSGGSLPAWLASCQIGADRHRRMTAVGALDAFQTLLWELDVSVPKLDVVGGGPRRGLR